MLKLSRCCLRCLGLGTHMVEHVICIVVEIIRWWRCRSFLRWWGCRSFLRWWGCRSFLRWWGCRSFVRWRLGTCGRACNDILLPRFSTDCNPGLFYLNLMLYVVRMGNYSLCWRYRLCGIFCIDIKNTV